MHAALERLCLLTFVIIADSREVLRTARRVAKVTRELIKAETHNERVLLKWEMLLTPHWRERVLRELGGVKALKRWERLNDRAAKRRAGITIVKPHASPAQRQARAANLAKAKAALFEKRAKTPRRFYDDSHPNIYKDPCKVDMKGQFRLAPIQRSKHKVKSQSVRAATPRRDVTHVKYSKIDPIPLWPQDYEIVGEFEAAAQSSSPVSPVQNREQSIACKSLPDKTHESSKGPSSKPP